jgi:hypothetical protein
MVNRDWHEELGALDGAAPPAVLRARLVPDAQEILICSYTADLRFFEATCLPEARAMRARVTVVHDDTASVTLADELRHAGTIYTDVPVRCRSGGAFHPKLLVIAGKNRAVAAIGSGNVTAAGWHHNAELWTVLGADADEWPDTFADLASWLRQLPYILHIDPFGASRLRDVADLLSTHQPTTPGVHLVHNHDRPIVHKIPNLTRSDGVTELGIASPFLDGDGAALTTLTKRLAPVAATLALTPRAVGPAGKVALWARNEGRRVYAIKGSRYHHGKLVEWRRGQRYTALVGSANVTAAAMLQTDNEHLGNCELGLILDAPHSLMPALLEDPLRRADLDGHLAEPPARQECAPGGRLLRVLVEGGSATAYLADTDAGTSDAQLIAPTISVPMQPGSAVPGSLALVASVTVIPGTLCSVQLADGTLLGPVRATDPVAVCVRPGTGSPLEDQTLPRVLRHPQLSSRLFQALAELAQVRPDNILGVGGRAGSRMSWRASAERAVGPALVTLALGGHRPDANHAADGDETATDEPSDRTIRPSIGDAVDETDEDDDVGTWDGHDVDTGVEDPWDVTGDPVSLLLSDTATARRIAKLVERRMQELDDWELPGVLALLRVSLLVAAGGGWDDIVWPTVVAGLLDSLKPAGSGEELEPSRQAAAAVGLAALASQIDDWDRPSELRAWFEEARRVLALDAEALDARLVAHYAADLHLGLGPQLTPDAVLDAAEFLIASEPLARVAEGLAQRYPGVRLVAPRLLELKASGNPQAMVMRLLSQCSEYAPVAVRLFGSDGELFAVWRPKRLLLQYQRGGGRGSEYQLPIGPGAYSGQPLPTPMRSWSGPVPADLRRELIDEGLLDS